MSDRLKYVYLASTSYSGSTLLCMLMNAHPQVASVGELTNMLGAYFKSGQLQEYPCSCGMEIRDCPFWANIRERCRERDMELDLYDFGTDLDAGLGYYANRVLFDVPGKFTTLYNLRAAIFRFIPAYRSLIERVVNREVSIARAVLAEAGKEVFLDGSKKLAQADQLRRREDLDFKLIHLVRDPRGYMNSFCRKKSADKFKTAAKSWLWMNTAVLEMVKPKIASDAYLLVRYEDLCEEPTKTLAGITAFLDLEPVDMVSMVNKEPHHIIGNRMRLKEFKGIQLDYSWRDYLTDEQLLECRRVTGDLSRKMGYEIGAGVT